MIRNYSKYLTSIPFRLDRLPWSRFHWILVISLGVTWILDGLEVTLKGAISGVLQDPRTLGLTPAQIGLISSWYLIGAVVGSLAFGYLTDRWGRKKLFYITLIIYLLGVTLSAFSWSEMSFCAFRFITGAGIGGEYSAINSTIDELVPARVRGRIDIMINGSYWLGTAVGALSTVFILDPARFAPDLGWRFGFATGGVIGLIILFLRRFVPESPRWLIVHGRREEAERVMAQIESDVARETGQSLDEPEKQILIQPRKTISLVEIVRSFFTKYRARSLVSLVLMTSQAFLYNAIFFTYAMVLTNYYQVPVQRTGLYLLPFAFGNFLGPFILGPFFDRIGRRVMISLTYAISAVLLLITGHLFAHSMITAEEQTLLWSIIFFFGSAAASSAYLTVSETFPLEVRGIAIALFFAIGTGIGGVVAPWLFGTLIGTGSRELVFIGYLIATVLLLATAAVEWRYGIDTEGRSLEEIARPISSRPLAEPR